MLSHSQCTLRAGRRPNARKPLYITLYGAGNPILLPEHSRRLKRLKELIRAHALSRVRIRPRPVARPDESESADGRRSSLDLGVIIKLHAGMWGPSLPTVPSIPFGFVVCISWREEFLAYDSAALNERLRKQGTPGELRKAPPFKFTNKNFHW
jgi:hypothetical protein